MAGKKGAIEVQGRKVRVEPVTARTYFDIQDEHEGSDRAINMALMAASIVDESGNAVYTPETVQDVPLPDFQRLQQMVTRANAYQGDAEKN